MCILRSSLYVGGKRNEAIKKTNWKDNGILERSTRLALTTDFDGGGPPVLGIGAVKRDETGLSSSSLNLASWKVENGRWVRHVGKSAFKGKASRPFCTI
jgi:hypothetical protein